MGRRWNANHLGIAAVAGLALALGLATARNFAPLHLLELNLQSVFFRLRGPILPPADIVVVAMDDDSLNRGPDVKELPELAPIQSWPWRRTAYAQAIGRLMAAGAKAVVLDVVLDTPSDYPQDDQALRQVLQRYAGRVTLAAMSATSETDAGSVDQLVYPADHFRTQPESIGFINFQPEVDGQFRRFTEGYLRQIAQDIGQPQTVLPSLDRASLQAAGKNVPAQHGEYINFYGAAKTFKTISFSQILWGKNWALLRQQQVFKDKIVLIGPTADVLQDAHLTPFGKMPGVEIHANAIATLLQNRDFVEVLPATPLQGGLLTLGMAVVGGLLYFGTKRPVLRFLGAGAIALGWLAIGYGVFLAGLLLPVAVPALGIAFGGLIFLGTGAFSDQTEKLRLRRTLERYVSGPIVREVLSQPEDFQTLLQGRQLNAAVLFCDIRGFTTLSYQMPAKQLVLQLNTYLDAMVNAIINQGGTIDKFIGDAVMAEFGSPVSQGEVADAMNAIRGALAMRQALADLRQRWQTAGLVPFYHGIGISYGEVIAGNIGSLKRLEYTVIGDAVNVASRVEGLTKNFWTDILITGPLYDLVQDQVDAVFVGEHTLRGRGEVQTRLYSLVGLKDADHQLYQQVHSELRRYLGFKLDGFVPATSNYPTLPKSKAS